MAQLDISTFSGHVESHELDKRQAVSIGSHPSNDIQVEGDDVEIMHCRISWNKSGFEVVAAGGDGVDVNGTLVQKVQLSSGDVLRVGDSDITFKDGDLARQAEESDDDLNASTFGLKPLTGEIEIPPAIAEEKEKKSPPPDEPLTADEIELEELEEIEEVPEKKRRSSKDKQKRSRDRKERERRERKRERAEKEERSSKKSKSRREEPEPDDAGEFDLEDLAAAQDEPAEKAAKVLHRKTDAAADESFDERVDEEPAPAPASEKLSLRQRLHSRPKRPGEA